MGIVLKWLEYGSYVTAQHYDKVPSKFPPIFGTSKLGQVYTQAPGVVEWILVLRERTGKPKNVPIKGS